MALAIDVQKTSGPHAPDSVSDSSPSRVSHDGEAGIDYISQRTRRTFVGRLLHAVGMDFRNRKPGWEHFSSQQDEVLEGLLRRRGSRDSRKYRRSRFTGFFRKALIVLPILALMIFGILHILQALIGRAILIWDSEIVEDFLPTWGLPGHDGAGMVSYPTDATRDVIPISCHSHNDYWRRVPLFDAIHWGCTGVEADVWLFDEELYVGHNTASLTRNRTFQNLYVKPLVALLDSMNPSTDFDVTTGHGVFDEKPEQELRLLVDLKTSGRETFPYVYRQLEPLRERGYLSHWDGDKFVSRAVTVVGTGNTPFDMVVANTTYRDIFFDAPLNRFWEDPSQPNGAQASLYEPNDDDAASAAVQDLAKTGTSSHSSSGQGKVGIDVATSPDAFDVSNSYYASVSFHSTVGFVWRGRITARQLMIIRGQIRGAQRRGLKVRYWDTPSWPVSLRNHVWYVLMREGADMLNVDDLKAAATLNWKLRIHGWW